MKRKEIIVALALSVFAIMAWQMFVKNYHDGDTSAQAAVLTEGNEPGILDNEIRLRPNVCSLDLNFLLESTASLSPYAERELLPYKGIDGKPFKSVRGVFWARSWWFKDNICLPETPCDHSSAYAFDNKEIYLNSDRLAGKEEAYICEEIVEMLARHLQFELGLYEKQSTFLRKRDAYATRMEFQTVYKIGGKEALQRRIDGWDEKVALKQ